MCGIVGAVNFKSTVDIRLINRMNNAIKHRGPNDEGYLLLNAHTKKYEIRSGIDTVKYYKDNYLSIDSTTKDDYNVAFGHRRLSILDLSELGHQPMSNENQSIWITFNGEIYNYEELKEELLKLGHVFKSNTDTEVIIHAYEQWGEECLKKFNGMWAFALFDFNKEMIFCSRDRFGVKPFYYYLDDSKFVFASEIKAILEDKSIKREVNDDIAYDYIRRARQDHTNKTFFKGIYQIEPSSYMTISKGEAKVARYYNIGDFSSNENLENSKDTFLSLLEDSIKLRLRSDVPFGSALSGGLDSSSIVSLVDSILKKQNSKEKSHTFSSVFDNKKYDEQEYIDAVNEEKGCIPHKISPKAEDLIHDIKKLVYLQDEPFGSLSIYAQWSVMKLVSQTDVKVLLDGQGADEILAGYSDSYDDYMCDLIKQFNFSKIVKELKARKKYIGVPIHKSLGRIAYASIPENIKAIYRGKNFKVKKMYKSKLKNGLYYMLCKYNLPSYLHYEDRNSMSFSIESRVPFLDYRLVEFAFSLPNKYKINEGTTKYIMREALEGILPEKVRDRKDKMGFVTPQVVWQENELKQFMEDVINCDKFKARKYFNKIDFNKVDPYTTWRCVNMELWMEEFID